MSSSAPPPVWEAAQLRRIADELAGQVREAETAPRIRQAADGAARRAAVVLTQAACRYDLGPVWNSLTVALRIIVYQAERGRRPTQDELGECCELSDRTLAYLRRPPAPRLPAPADLSSETWAAIQPDWPPPHDALHTWFTVILPRLRQLRPDDFPLDRAEYDFTNVPRVESAEARAIRQGRADGEPFDWAAYRRATEAVPGFGPPGRYSEPLARDHERGRAALYETAMRVAADLLDESWRPNQPPAPPEMGASEPGVKPDGPFGMNEFWYRGVPVPFGKAAMQYTLMLALWDERKKQPREPRLVGEVIDEVYGHDSDPEDSAFRQLCSDTRRKLESANCKLTIRSENGKVELVPV